MKERRIATNVPFTRHQANCSICAHSQRPEIEREFVNWASPNQIAADFQVTRDSIYRHAWATGLVTNRQQNVRRALERIIEHAGDVEVNAYAVVAAVSAYARINARGEWVQRSEIANLNKLFERMDGGRTRKLCAVGRAAGMVPSHGGRRRQWLDGGERRGDRGKPGLVYENQSQRERKQNVS